MNQWAGEFGDGYTLRNPVTPDAVTTRVTIMADMLSRLNRPTDSILEVGANVGLNLRALNAISLATLFAVEPNESACDVLVAEGMDYYRVFQTTGDAIPVADASIDLVFTCGVLIHVLPADLAKTMAEIHRVSSRYIWACEYFAPREEMIPYRGQPDLMWRRDYGSLYLDTFPDLELVDYGFYWKRVTGMDDCTWWLFRKRLADKPALP